MRIAIIILAFKNAGQLRKLVDALKSDFAVYIHFDRRSDIAALFQEEENVHIAQKRYPIYWGSINAQLAVLELLQQAYKDNNDYYIVISGQDLPVMSNKQLSNYIERNYKDHLYHFPLPGTWSGNGGLDRMTLFWENKYNTDTFLKKLLSIPLRGSFAALRLVQKITGLKRPIPFTAYGGSFCLNFTKEAVSYILRFLDADPGFIKRFRHTRCTDEIFFQTILLGFDYGGKDDIVNSDKRYQNWTKGPGYPRVFTMEDLEDCMNSGDFFARKFDEKVDGEVIDKILELTR